MLVAGCRTLIVMSAIRFLMILLERRADWDLDFAGVGQDQRQREAIDVAAHEIRPWQTGQPAFTALAFWSQFSGTPRRGDELPAVAGTRARIVPACMKELPSSATMSNER
jgi:hypothetical protein